jgi:SOS-response transcriptional repressor LexA
MSNPIPPTPFQRDALLIIQELYDATGAMPSYREIARELDCNPSSAFRVVDCLCDRGWLRRNGTRVRSLQILHRFHVALEETEIEVTELGRDALDAQTGLTPFHVEQA